ncbi:hypothetical protein C5167_050896 [Papaver somniferum]|uniref:Uncharacterized protein n=1 Tax=Papaver somniferum TaxID=3469 RepID=A0A4Y7KPZ8_PAPSO|nr:hypothetical protein C5167_050896 [Papaver somniferum]
MAIGGKISKNSNSRFKLKPEEAIMVNRHFSAPTNFDSSSNDWMGDIIPLDCIKAKDLVDGDDKDSNDHDGNTTRFATGTTSDLKDDPFNNSYITCVHEKYVIRVTHYPHRNMVTAHRTLVSLGLLTICLGLFRRGSRGQRPLGNAKSIRLVSWLIWRNTYLTCVISWRNRFYVPVNCATTLVFGRDNS